MDVWQIGLIVLIVVGLGLVVFGALWDRNRNRKRAAEMLAPPKREIPRFRPDAPAPHYLSDLQARRPPESAVVTELSADERSALKVRIAEPDIVTIKTGYASKDFVTDKSSGWAVLDHPRVLVCADPVETIRELLPVLEPMIMSKTPLVIAAPRLADEVRATLEVNQIRQTVPLLAADPGRGRSAHRRGGDRRGDHRPLRSAVRVRPDRPARPVRALGQHGQRQPRDHVTRRDRPVAGRTRPRWLR